MTISDRGGNELVYDYNDLNEYKAEVTDINGLIDTYSPIFNSISIAKDRVKVGETINIIADVVDNESVI